MILESLTHEPVNTVAEARERIEQLTGLDRGLTQTRKFLKGLGMTRQRLSSTPASASLTLPQPQTLAQGPG
jgi:hypothetical protein